MDVERSSQCNWVVNFLLEESYLLSAFELLHELLDDGRDDQAIRLKEFFSDPSRFPPDQITRLNLLKAADPQSLFEEKELLGERLAVREYELRLAKEDILNLKAELLRKTETNLDESSGIDDTTASDMSIHRPENSDTSLLALGPLKDNERFDINCAVKEYLLLAGYRLTAMTFYEEVTDQNSDVWQNSTSHVPDALRHYYYQYLSSTGEAAKEKIAMLRENDSLRKENDALKSKMQSLTKSKEMLDAQVVTMTKSLDLLQKDIKDKENLVQNLKKTLDRKRKEINDFRAEITSLKMRIEESLSRKSVLATDSTFVQQLEDIQNTNDEHQNGFDSSTVESSVGEDATGSLKRDANSGEVSECEDTWTPDNTPSSHAELVGSNTENMGINFPQKAISVSEGGPEEDLASPIDSHSIGKSESMSPVFYLTPMHSRNAHAEPDTRNIGLEAIQVLSDALPKIVPYVLINHREELLPLIMCAIEQHPESATRDSLTHTLFNLIKRPDEHQRRIIMDACVSLAKNVGELRTETELLPQCWEQINHMYEERRLLVAQSCGELAQHVRPEIRDSLIFSIVQQLVEDSAAVVREAAAHNLALLLTLFPSTDKYLKVEEVMFHLVCDPSGTVVETTMKDLVPALIKWGNNLDHVLHVLFTHLIQSALRCPPLSGVDGSVESHLHVLDERERWNIDVLLRLLNELLPYLHQRAVETFPFSTTLEAGGILFCEQLLESYARGDVAWPSIEWFHIECYPTLIRLSSLLPQKEDSIRSRVVTFLLAMVECFGEHYSTHIMLPVFLLAVGEDVDLKFFPFKAQAKLRGLRPHSVIAQRLATMTVLPLLIAGIFGHPSKRNQLTEYLRDLLVRHSGQDDPAKHDVINAIRFICTNEENQGLVFSILWEMVASSNVNPKITAADLLKVIVPYIDEKAASAHVLPALVTLGSDPNINVKCASIDAFGSVAQHFMNTMIIDKIRIQMDAFLEDGSHKATISVIRALLVAAPHTTDTLRDYLVSKIFKLTSLPPPSSDVQHRERSNAFCESIRALDATDLSATSVKDFLIPSIQNLLKDSEALDPAHKEALEIILRERSGGTLDSFSKVMGSHLGGLASVSSFFGETGLLGKKETTESIASTESNESPRSVPVPAEETRFRRIMRGGFTDILRGRSD